MSAHSTDPRAALETALEQGRLDHFETLMDAAAPPTTQDATLYRRWARLCLAHGQGERAAQVLGRYLAANPGQTEVLADLGAVCESLGHKFEALGVYRQQLAANPADSLARELFAQGLTEQNLQALTGRTIGREASKSYAAKLYAGFFRTWLSGRQVLDIGFKGGYGNAQPIVPQAVGVDLDYPGYDGITLPFADQSQDAVYTSHCLEHIPDPVASLRDWFRVLRIGGYAVIVVPHQFLYERRAALPSFHSDHKHLFSPATLLAVVERALPPNHYRVRHLADNDLMFDYSVPLATHPVGCYEIELVLEKIQPPAWSLA